ncbi:MAG: ABC transporter permease [Firmicutes bacterium]|nr:ABC transporter permease [Bacillota bacterium]
MDLRRICAITHKDFVEALRNKTILIAVFLPLAASLFLAVIDSPQQPQFFHIGITGPESSQLQTFLTSAAPDTLAVYRYPDITEGKEAITAGQIDALILVTAAGDLTAYLDGSNPLTYLALKDMVETLLAAYKGQALKPVVDLVVVNQGKASASLLPLWLTITAVMIGVMVLSGSFAEEKEKGTLDNIRISPATDGEILLSKGISGTLLVMLISLIMLVLNRVQLSQQAAIGCGLLLLLGAISFTAIGLLIGLFTKTQSAARAISTIVYFPLIFPALAADISETTQYIAAILPSFYLYRGLKGTLQHQASLSAIRADILGLTLFAVILASASFLGYRRVLRQDR